MMKEDKLVTTAFKLVEYFQRNLNRILLFSGIAVVLIVAVVFFFQLQIKREQKARNLYSKARAELSSGNYLQAINDLNIVSSSYGGTEVAPQAMFLLGNAYFYSRNYDRALVTFEDFSKRYKDDPQLSSSALAGIAQCYLEKSDYLSAGEYFVRAAEADTGSFLASDFLFQAGYCYRKGGGIEKAKEILERIIENSPESQEVYQAKLHLAEITYGNVN
jgi:outer membrane protein assembly factor BamD (BamD/ComL family)